MRLRGVTSKRGRVIAGALAVGLAAATFGLVSAFADPSSSNGSDGGLTKTPIKHMLVIYQENQSFDHLFGTYPETIGRPGVPSFTPAPGTPSVVGLSHTLLTDNPNSANPRRLSRSEAVTCSNDHGYADEQKAFDGGLMDKFPQFTAGGGCTDKTLVMDYYDGETVTALWNYANHFALEDNSFGTQFGPSTVGAINLIAGETHGATPENIPGSTENGTVIGDPDPALDDCGKGGVQMSGKNVGDLLNEHGITWAWAQGGFEPTETKEGKAVCGSSHRNIANASVMDYSAHHNPFEYYASTANPHHLPPTSVAMFGHTDQANHEYDISDFRAALKAENLPAVTFLKAPAYEDGHPSNSDPLDEQRFLVETINSLERSPEWSETAVVIAYDDSDGWYDSVMPPIVSPSKAPSDAVSGPGECGHVTDESAPLDRCGYGPRLPLEVISPYAKHNYVDSTLTDQTSILKFIEENWELGPIGENSMDAKAGSLDGMFDFSADPEKAPKVFLDPETGMVTEETGGGETASPATPETGGNPGTGGSSGSAGSASGAAAVQASPVNREAHAATKTHVAMSCSVSGRNHLVDVACKVSGGGKGRGAVRYRLEGHGKVLGTARAPINGGMASATIHCSRTLDGTYRLAATVDRPSVVTALSADVVLPGREKFSLR